MYDALRVQLIGTLEVCDVYACLKAKAQPLRKKTRTGATIVGERTFMETNGPFP